MQAVPVLVLVPETRAERRRVDNALVAEVAQATRLRYPSNLWDSRNLRSRCVHETLQHGCVDAVRGLSESQLGSCCAGEKEYLRLTSQFSLGISTYGPEAPRLREQQAGA